MRVKFRISLYLEGKKLKKTDLKNRRDPLGVGLRYITEFKYLEATKWLLLAPDSYEKYVLLGLINLALGQVEQAREFFSALEDAGREAPLKVVIEIPEKGKRIEVQNISDIAGVLGFTP